MHVAIAGGGIGGLTMASALAAAQFVLWGAARRRTRIAELTAMQGRTTVRTIVR